MTVKSSFDIVLFKRIKYIWLWGAISVVAFIISGMLLKNHGEDSFLITRIFIVLSVTLWPIAYSLLAKKFASLYTESIAHLFVWESNESDDWYINIATKAFRLKRSNLIITIVLWFFGILTVYSMPLPFKTNTINFIGRLGLSAILFIGVHSVPLIFYCVKALYELTKKEVSANFYANGYELLQAIKKFYMGFAVAITAINFSLFLGFYYSPYGFNEILIVWISFISLWPIIMYISSLYNIKVVENKAKKVYIDALNQHVICPSLENLIIEHKNEDFENVKRNIEFRDYMLKYNMAKIEFAPILTILTTILAGAFQIIVAILSQVKP